MGIRKKNLVIDRNSGPKKGLEQSKNLVETLKINNLNKIQKSRIKTR